jgi:hypothetical protein
MNLSQIRLRVDTGTDANPSIVVPDPLGTKEIDPGSLVSLAIALVTSLSSTSPAPNLFSTYIRILNKRLTRSY